MQHAQANGAKSYKEGSRSNQSTMQLQHQQHQQQANMKKSNRYQSSSNGRGITPTQESKSPHLITQHHNIQSHQQLQGGSASGQPINYVSQYTNQGRNGGAAALLESSGSSHSRSVNQATSSGQAGKAQGSSQQYAQYHASSQAQLSKAALQGNT